MWTQMKWFYQHSLHNLFGSSVASGFDADNVLNGFETNYWKPTSVNTQCIVFDAGSGSTIPVDYLAFTEHNFRTIGAAVCLEACDSSFLYVTSRDYINYVDVSSGGMRRQEHACVAYNDNIYYIGGMGSDGLATSTVWKYNVTSQSFTQCRSMSYARYGQAAVCIGNEIWVHGGIDDAGARSAEMLRYNVVSDAWAMIIQGGPGARSHHAAAVINANEILLAGGRVGSNANLAWKSDVWKYQLNSNWLQLSSLSLPREGQAVTINNDVYLFGSLNGFTSGDTRNFKYFTNSNAWVEIASGYQSYGFGCAAITSNEIILISGFTGAGLITPQTWIFNTTSAQPWRRMTDMTSGRGLFPAVVISGDAYICHGYSPTVGKWPTITQADRLYTLQNSVITPSSFTTVVSPFYTDTDHETLRTFPQVTKRSWRMTIVSTISVLPWVAIAQWGTGTTLAYIDVNTDPHEQEMKANINISQTGYLQGTWEHYTERRMEIKFPSMADSFYTSTINSWWTTNRMKNFFVQWEPTEHASEVWLMHPEPRMKSPMFAGGLYRDIFINLVGRKTE